MPSYPSKLEEARGSVVHAFVQGSQHVIFERADMLLVAAIELQELDLLTTSYSEHDGAVRFVRDISTAEFVRVALREFKVLYYHKQNLPKSRFNVILALLGDNYLLSDNDKYWRGSVVKTAPKMQHREEYCHPFEEI